MPLDVISIYDSFKKSKQSSDKPTVRVKDVIGILASGRFRLTQWVKNSREVLIAIPSSDLPCDIVHLDLNEWPQEKALLKKIILLQFSY